jgi:hypothetical protein
MDGIIMISDGWINTFTTCNYIAFYITPFTLSNDNTQNIKIPTDGKLAFVDDKSNSVLLTFDTEEFKYSIEIIFKCADKKLEKLESLTELPFIFKRGDSLISANYNDISRIILQYPKIVIRKVIKYNIYILQDTLIGVIKCIR